MGDRLKQRRYHQDLHHRPSLAYYRNVRPAMVKARQDDNLRVSKDFGRMARAYLATFDIFIVFLAMQWG